MKNITLVLALLCSNYLYAQHNFDLHAKVPPVLNNEKIYLRIYDFYSQKKFDTVDSTTVLNEQFSFHGKLNHPSEFADIYITKQKKTIGAYDFILDTGTMKMIIEEPTKSPKYAVYLLDNTKILNSRSNLIRSKLDSISNIYKDANSVRINKDTPYPRYLPTDKERELSSIQFDFLSNYPDDYYSLMEIYSLSRMASMITELDAPLKAFYNLSPTIQSSALGKEFLEMQTSRKNAYNSAKAGLNVPEFSIKTDNGVLFSNASLKGKPYVIAFSATWCTPCQIYQPKLLSLFHKYRKDNLNVVYFNLDDNVPIWKKHIKDKGLDWINVSERTKFANSKIAKQFYASAIPLYIIVNAQGKIIYNAQQEKDYNYNQLEKYIQKAIAN